VEKLLCLGSQKLTKTASVGGTMSIQQKIAGLHPFWLGIVEQNKNPTAY
jgi:hypothetical protein